MKDKGTRRGGDKEKYSPYLLVFLLSEMMMKTNLLLVVLLLFCVAAPSGCRRAAPYQKPARPVQAQEAQSYYPGGEPGAGERYSANILPSSQTELAFRYGGYLSEIH